MPELHLDYCFLRDGVGKESRTVLVVKERGSKVVFSHVMPVKGANFEWNAAQVLRDLTKMGIQNDVKLVLKSDQEHAIVDLVK